VSVNGGGEEKERERVRVIAFERECARARERAGDGDSNSLESDTPYHTYYFSPTYRHHYKLAADSRLCA